jgi:hypothetical protein
MLPAENFYWRILIFKRLTARRLYKSLGVKGLNDESVRKFLSEAHRGQCGLVPNFVTGGKVDLKEINFWPEFEPDTLDTEPSS